MESEHKNPEIDKLDVLYRLEKGVKLNILESIEIYKTSKNPFLLKKIIPNTFVGSSSNKSVEFHMHYP